MSVCFQSLRPMLRTRDLHATVTFWTNVLGFSCKGASEEDGWAWLCRDKVSVMIVNAQNRLEPREVSTGLESPATVEIVSGLAEHELVVVGSQGQLKPGQVVTPKETGLGSARGGR